MCAASNRPTPRMRKTPKGKPALRPSGPRLRLVRGIAMVAHPTILMDVVMGSGSIFPVFPPRQMHDFPTAGESIWLVDGGFAHNSPVEAAVLWGATLIVVIEASPKVRTSR